MEHVHSDQPTHPLRVLVANEQPDRANQLVELVRGLGYELVGETVVPAEVGALASETLPDVVLVGFGDDPAHALRMIRRIVHEALAPVVAVLHSDDPEFVAAAAKQGVFACVIGDDPVTIHTAIEVVLRRFHDFKNLRGAFARRAVIERAKGILMERHGVDEHTAFARLREQSQRTGVRVAELAGMIEQTHLLLGATAAAPSQPANAG